MGCGTSKQAKGRNTASGKPGINANDAVLRRVVYPKEFVFAEHEEAEFDRLRTLCIDRRLLLVDLIPEITDVLENFFVKCGFRVRRVTVTEFLRIHQLDASQKNGDCPPTGRSRDSSFAESGVLSSAGGGREGGTFRDQRRRTNVWSDPDLSGMHDIIVLTDWVDKRKKSKKQSQGDDSIGPSLYEGRRFGETPLPTLEGYDVMKRRIKFSVDHSQRRRLESMTLGSVSGHGRGSTPIMETHVARSHVDATTGKQRINEYQVLHEIGKGTFGQVFKVQKLDTLEYFAVKVCRKESLRKMSLDGGGRRYGGVGVNRKVGSLRGPNGAVPPERKPKKNQSGLSLVLREIMLWKILDHPNIVRLREVINDPESDDLFMVSDFMSGGMLGHMISLPDGRLRLEKGPWREEKVQEVFIDILQGLAYLHHNGIAHRDIKLDNLLLDDTGRVHLADFGLSQLLEVDVIAGSDNQGTPFYLPPSIGRQGSKETFAADFWAVGVCLYVLLVGEFPFFGKTPYLLRRSIRFDEVVFPPSIPLSEDARSLVVGLLDKDAATRWSMDDVMKHPWVQMCMTTSPYGTILDSSHVTSHSSELEETVDSSGDWAQILRLDRVDMSNVDTSEAMTETSSNGVWSSLVHGIRVIGVLRGRLSLARKSLGRRKSSCSSASSDDTRLNLLVISPFWPHQVSASDLFWQRCIDDEEWSQDPSLFAYECLRPGKFTAVDLADSLTGLIVRFPSQ